MEILICRFLAISADYSSLFNTYSNKYEYVKFPEADVWGAIMPSSHPLAKKKSIHVSDLIGEPLFVSEQSWNNEIKTWAKERFPKLKLEGSFRLSYNGSVFARENLGILLTFKDLINTEGTDMVFRPLSPELKSEHISFGISIRPLLLLPVSFWSR